MPRETGSGETVTIDRAKLERLLGWLAPQWTPEQRRQTVEELAVPDIIIKGQEATWLNNL